MNKVKLQITATINDDGKNDIHIECDMSTLVVDAAVACQCAIDGLRDSARMVMEAENVKDLNDIESVINSKLDNMTFQDVLNYSNNEVIIKTDTQTDTSVIALNEIAEEKDQCDLQGKRPGRIVQHIDGRRGRTFNDTNIIEGKVPVYFAIEYNKQVPVKFSTTASLVDPAKLSVIGYID